MWDISALLFLLFCVWSSYTSQGVRVLISMSCCTHFLPHLLDTSLKVSFVWGTGVFPRKWWPAQLPKWSCRSQPANRACCQGFLSCSVSPPEASERRWNDKTGTSCDTWLRSGKNLSLWSRSWAVSFFWHEFSSCNSESTSLCTWAWLDVVFGLPSVGKTAGCAAWSASEPCELWLPHLNILPCLSL